MTDVVRTTARIPPSPAPTSPAQALTARLEELSRLPAGWDGCGARPVDPLIAAAARRLVERLPADLLQGAFAVPTAAGGLQLEWHRGRRVLELEFESASVLHTLKWDPSAAEEQEDVIDAGDVDGVVALARWFHGERPR